MLTPLLLAAVLAAAPDSQPVEAPPTTQPEAEVIREAPLPEGWPEPDSSGEVVVKELPAYRMAVTDAGGRMGGGAFWTLFRHIRENEIEMTAPVEMGMQREGGDAAATQPADEAESDQPLRMSSMAFLYRRADHGKAGENGNVRVVDVPATTVLSIGFFGNPDREAVAEMETKLRESLQGDGPFNHLQPAGPPRLLGYNSPMVASDRRFHEMQIPVRERDAPQTQPTGGHDAAE